MTTQRTPRPVGFNLFEMNCVSHISHGLWSTPTHPPPLQRPGLLGGAGPAPRGGTFDAVFLADVIGAYDGYRGGPETALREAVQIPGNDPLL